MARKKAAAQNYIGKRGEAIAAASLLDFCGNPHPYFGPYFIGDKCPTYDLLVQVLDAGASSPYFLAQVKATSLGYNKETLNLKVALRASDVQRMVRCPIPTYLIGVDEPSAKAYIVSIHGKLTSRIGSIPSAYPLDRSNLKRLWEEVVAHWKILGGASASRTSAFSI